MGFAGKNTGVGSHSLLQGIFPTQGLNSGFLHYRRILYCLSHQGIPLYNIPPLNWDIPKDKQPTAPNQGTLALEDKLKQDPDAEKD